VFELYGAVLTRRNVQLASVAVRFSISAAHRGPICCTYSTAHFLAFSGVFELYGAVLTRGNIQLASVAVSFPVSGAHRGVNGETHTIARFWFTGGTAVPTCVYNAFCVEPTFHDGARIATVSCA